MFGIDDAAAAGIIGAGANLIGSAVSGIGQATMNRRQMAFNAEQAQLQRDWSEQMYNNQNAWNYKMWNEQNAYNTPEAQVQRLRDAGLNPLYYGLDGSSAGSAQPAAQPLGYERAQVGALGNPLASANDIGLRLINLFTLRLRKTFLSL